MLFFPLQIPCLPLDQVHTKAHSQCKNGGGNWFRHSLYFANGWLQRYCNEAIRTIVQWIGPKSEKVADINLWAFRHYIGRGFISIVHCVLFQEKCVVFRFSWKWPAMRMTGKLFALSRPLVTEVCRAESGQHPVSSGENLSPGQEMRQTAVMSQVRFKYFTKEILYFLDEMRIFIVIQSS